MAQDLANIRAYKRDKDEAMEVYKNRVIYSLPVRAGYWLNELAIREQREFLYNYKRDHCQLLIQKTRKMFRNLLKPTKLSPEDDYIQYNKNYQLKCDGMGHGQPLYLAGLITEHEIESTQHFIHGCIVTASPNRQSSIRNTFVFVDCDSGEKSGPLNYGEDVYIKISETDNLPLFLQCENPTMDTFGAHLKLRLSQSPDIYCRFKVFHWKPKLRLETSGTFVLQLSHCIIQHCASGHNLAAEFRHWVPTFFGSECSVSCHTFRDSAKMETGENLWRIVGVENTDLSNVDMRNPENNKPQ